MDREIVSFGRTKSSIQGGAKQKVCTAKSGGVSVFKKYLDELVNLEGEYWDKAKELMNKL